MDDVTDDFRYVYIEMIDGFSACKFRYEKISLCGMNLSVINREKFLLDLN